MEQFLLNIDGPKLPPQEAAGLESPITEAEIRKAISSMKNGKSPGDDGLPVEYFVVPALQRVYQEMFEKGRVAPTLNEAAKQVKMQQIPPVLDLEVCFISTVRFLQNLWPHVYNWFYPVSFTPIRLVS